MGKIFLLALGLLMTARVGHPAPYVIFKFDDLNESMYPGFKSATDLCKAKGAKSSVGIWTNWAGGGGAAFTYYLNGIVADPDCEIWFHGTDGGAYEFSGTSYSQQKNSVLTGRRAMLVHHDYLLRTINPHWHSGDATTVTVFNEDPFLRVYLCYVPAGIRADANMNIQGAFELGDTHTLLDYATLVSSFNSYASWPYVVYQGHPWNWGSADLDIFSRFLDYLNAQGVTYATPFEYYKIRSGITDVTPPPAPAGAYLTRVSGQSIRINWNPSVDLESGTDGYKLYRNGAFLDIVTAATTTYTDAPGYSLPDNTRYQISTINKANLSSVKADCSFGTPNGIVIEAEDMTLTNGYLVDAVNMNSQGIMVDATLPIPSTGTAMTTFDGASDVYDITICIVPENDGQPALSVYIGGTRVLHVVYPTDQAYTSFLTDRYTYEVKGVTVNQGAQIRLEGTSDGNAFARVDNLVFTPASTGLGVRGVPALIPDGKGISWFPDPLQALDLRMSRYGGNWQVYDLSGKKLDVKHFTADGMYIIKNSEYHQIRKVIIIK